MKNYKQITPQRRTSNVEKVYTGKMKLYITDSGLVTEDKPKIKTISKF